MQTSKLTHTRGQIDDMLRDLKVNKKPIVQLNKVEATSNPGFARVVATIGANTAKEGNALDAIASLLSNKIRPIAGSFQVLASDAATVTITGIVNSNPEAIAYSEDTTGFRSVSGNIFLDEQDNAWTLQKTESGNILIRSRSQNDDDVISEAMQSVSSGAVGTSTSAGLNQYRGLSGSMNHLAGGDFIAFVNPNTQSVQFGAVAAAIVDGSNTDNIMVVASGSEEGVAIDRRMVLCAIDDVELADDGLYIESTSSGQHSIEEIIAYYTRLFQRHPAYAELFLERWKAHMFQ